MANDMSADQIGAQDHDYLVSRIAAFDEFKEHQNAATNRILDKLDAHEKATDARFDELDKKLDKLIKWFVIIIAGGAAGGNAVSDLVKQFVGGG